MAGSVWPITTATTPAGTWYGNIYNPPTWAATNVTTTVPYNYVVWQDGTSTGWPMFEPMPVRRYRRQQPAVYTTQHERVIVPDRRILNGQKAQLSRHVDAAKSRAMELLMENLSPEQRETFEKNRWFVVEGGKSGKQYRVHDNEHMAANVEVIVDGRPTHALCAHCDLDAVPLGDQLLAQKLMLELAEDDFLRKANRHARLMAA